jgi:hypothetical protein
MPESGIDNNLDKVITLCYNMLELADLGDKIRLDAGCGAVYGSLRDNAYKLRKMAEEELVRHGGGKKRSGTIRQGY